MTAGRLEKRATEDRLREEVVFFCKLLHQKNFLAGNDGNVSARLDEGRFLMTPTGVHKGFLRAEDLVVIDATGRLLSGTRAPSAERAMHLYAYNARPDIGAVVHAHPPTCIALSLLDRPLDGFLPEVVLSIGSLSVIPYARPITEALADSLQGHIETKDAMILERHGTLTVGSSVADAYGKVERLEHAAAILWMAYAAGTPRPLDDAEMSALREMYEKSRVH
jgi:L-fuculose-phosphate aldolase